VPHAVGLVTSAARRGRAGRGSRFGCHPVFRGRRDGSKTVTVRHALLLVFQVWRAAESGALDSRLLLERLSAILLSQTAGAAREASP
jgi:hypothetical protein